MEVNKYTHELAEAEAFKNSSNLLFTALAISIVAHLLILSAINQSNNVKPSQNKKTKTVNIRFFKTQKSAPQEKTKTIEIEKAAHKKPIVSDTSPQTQNKKVLPKTEPVQKLDDISPTTKKQPPNKSSKPKAKSEPSDSTRSPPASEKRHARDGVVLNPKLRQQLENLKTPKSRRSISPKTYSNVYGEEHFQMGDKCFKRVESGDQNQMDTWSLPMPCPGTKDESDKIIEGLRKAMNARNNR